MRNRWIAETTWLADHLSAPDVIVDGYNGFLAEPENPEDLADKIKKGLNADIEFLSEQARESVQKYDWEMIGKDYRDRIFELFE